jgi:hypothetical protein
MLGLPDAYSVQARLLPALIGFAPAIALAAVLVPWDEFGLPQALITAGVVALFFSFSDIARRFGLRAERKMFESSGGRPFPTVLRHADHILDAVTKKRYLNFLAAKLGEVAPTLQQEEADPDAADGFYIRCGQWLRERTRDKARFDVLFRENVTYGFRRNLFGLKWFGLLLNLAVVATCVILYRELKIGPQILQGILVFAAIHAVFFLLYATKKAVRNASEKYGRQLALACENFFDP